VSQGYVEGEFVAIASPYAGVLDSLFVARGDQVAAGRPLFVLEREAETASTREADARRRSAQARLDDLRATRRSPELDAARAEIVQARAARDLSRTLFDRAAQLWERGLVAQEQLDEARARLQRDSARLEQLEAQLRLAEQSVGRDRELAAAQAEADAAAAALAQANWSREQKARLAPQAGRVHETYYVQGEWVPAGRPVVSLLPPGNLKIRFFVPEGALSSVRLGRTVQVDCDGCDQRLEATVNWIATKAEYTPPLIYSRDQRRKLVFMVEARPAFGSAALHPGQPVDVAW
jgi:HlyD family secretion protein